MNEPCIDCEKPVNVSSPHWRIHIMTGDIDMGWHAIGPECRRDHPDAEQFEGSSPMWG